MTTTWSRTSCRTRSLPGQGPPRQRRGRYPKPSWRSSWSLLSREMQAWAYGRQSICAR